MPQFDEGHRHIDLFNVAPGVKTSLKVYMARMHAETLQDLPYHHDEEIDTPDKRKVVNFYCCNDVEGTYQLFLRLQEEIELRRHLSAEFDLDLMSKSDAQMAEAIFNEVLKLPKPKCRLSSFSMCCQAHYQDNNKVLLELIKQSEEWDFEINQKNGSPVQPDWMKDASSLSMMAGTNWPGGLHSTHDLNSSFTPTMSMR